MTAVKWDGSELFNSEVIQYWSCHSVNLIDDYVASRNKYQQPNKLEHLSLKFILFFPINLSK